MTRFSVSGEFIASVEINDINWDDFSSDDDVSKMLGKLIQRKVIKRMDEVLEKVGKESGLNLVYMPQYIHGMMIEP
jgi:hypothetical protein